MIVCTKCHGLNDDVMNRCVTIYSKYNKILNIKCLVCDEYTLESVGWDGAVVILDEHTGFFDNRVHG